MSRNRRNKRTFKKLSDIMSLKTLKKREENIAGFFDENSNL